MIMYILYVYILYVYACINWTLQVHEHSCNGISQYVQHSATVRAFEHIDIYEQMNM
jgi:hypothetical protein